MDVNVVRYRCSHHGPREIIYYSPGPYSPFTPFRRVLLLWMNVSLWAQRSLGVNMGPALHRGQVCPGKPDARAAMRRCRLPS